MGDVGCGAGADVPGGRHGLVAGQGPVAREGLVGDVGVYDFGQAEAARLSDGFGELFLAQPEGGVGRLVFTRAEPAGVFFAH